MYTSSSDIGLFPTTGQANKPICSVIQNIYLPNLTNF